LHPFDKTGRQSQQAAVAPLRAGHAAPVLLVVHAGEMEHPVQHQNSDLGIEPMAVASGLLGGAID
jgi:hypothetical protein